MARAELRGWRAAVLVAVVYVYFLIFAQFAFLKRLAALGLAGNRLDFAMAAMALGGMLASLLAPIGFRRSNSAPRLRLALGGCAVSALCSLLPLELWSAMIVAAAIGISLGLATIAVVADLRNWSADGDPLWLAALGTGLAYLLCNLPALFSASAKQQTMAAALLCILAIGLTRPAPSPARLQMARRTHVPAFSLVLAAFLTLVWLDSAAFFLIQQSPALKAGTWQGAAHLWTNGIVHFAAAILSALLLARRGIRTTLVVSVAALGAACLLLAQPEHLWLASLLYPAGVSLYSVALVAYPAVLANLPNAQVRARRAGVLYAVAGWAGSALGIGMGQHLGHVPPALVGVALLVVLLPLLAVSLRAYWRELATVSVALLAAWLLYHGPLRSQPRPLLTQIERGRRVYISEGCIHCHSQYVRPGSADELLWGPVTPVAFVHQQQPPLIGNRRQGPDLSQVGGRRSPLWFKLHFLNPPEVSGASIMPAYAFLFRDGRGEDLVAYLTSLQASTLAQHRIEEENWLPSSTAIEAANGKDGEQGFRRYCSTCHEAGGQTRWAGGFRRLPPDLTVGPYTHLSFSGGASAQRNRLARIVKFGIHETDMPGHEYLSDQQIASISLWLSRQIRQPGQNQ